MHRIWIRRECRTRTCSIRTSGELRLSNYLLWQLAYTEIMVTDCLWPDFGQEELEKAIVQYNKRERRFGAVK